MEYLLATVISFGIAVLIGPIIIKQAKKLKFGQNILSYVENHKSKQGTPTMGGVIFVFSSIITSLILIKQSFAVSLTAMAVFFAFGVLGFLDDYLKIKNHRNLGLRAYQKVIGQLGISLIVGLFVYFNGGIGDKVVIPFSNTSISLGWLVIPFIIFVFIGATNSVNLTDGLDGLAGGTSFIYLIGIATIVLLYAGGSPDIEQKNLLIFIFAVVGGVLGFLVFNTHPASIFMGDTGSLALGSVVAISGCFTGLSLYIPIIGFLFVMSALSVIIQVLHYKRTKTRVFLMAPLHHHFEKKGMYETKIVAIYIIITILLSVLSVLLTIVCRG